MVFFECQKCNESVKKPKLAKHLQSCRSYYVSCIDCSKVFAWNEWESHTSCISEAQKYQGSLYQAKENNNKGQKKQDAWIENVEQLIHDPSSKIPPMLRSTLQKLLGFSNIPRKQKPFTNFVKASLKMHNEKQIAEIWEIISSANQKAAPGKQTEVAAPNGATIENGGNSPAQWAGWKRALDDELKILGGEAPWKKIRDGMVTRFREGNTGTKEADDHLGQKALASIPDSYLSKEDELIRMPSV